MESYKGKAWVRQPEAGGKQYIVSPSRDLLDTAFIQRAFASSDMPWAKELPVRDMDVMLDNSFTFGLYERDVSSEDSSSITPDSLEKTKLRQIGLARLITDYVTFAWVTDVYVLPESQGTGLGRWIVQCLAEVLRDMKRGGSLRRSMLLTGNPKLGIDFYRKELGMEPSEQDMDNLVVMTTSGKLE